MKKKIMILLLVVFIPFVFVSAEEDLLDSTLDVSLENEIYDGSKFNADLSVNSKENVDGINFAAGSSVNISGQNEYGVYAGSSVNINGNILKELFVAGSSVNINESTIVGRDSYIAGSTVNMSGSFNRNVYVGAGSLVLSDVTINGDIKLFASNITFLNNVVINGVLEYNDNAEVSGIDQANIFTIKNYHVEEDDESTNIISQISSSLYSIVSLIIIAFIINLLFPKIYKSLDKNIDSKELLNKALIGLAILFLTPLAAILCMITGVGLGLGFIILTIYILLCCLSSLTIMSVVGNNVLTKLLKKEENIYLSIVIGIVLFKLIYLLPYIGGLLSFVTILVGLGYSKELLFSNKK